MKTVDDRRVVCDPLLLLVLVIGGTADTRVLADLAKGRLRTPAQLMVNLLTPPLPQPSS
jgi:hypothetical protein